MNQRTFALVKSGAVSRGSVPRILDIIRAGGLEIVREEAIVPLSLDVAKQLYCGKEDMPYWTILMVSVTGSSGVYAMVLEGPDAVKKWRAMMGASKCDGSPTWRDTIRGRFGGPGEADNAVHGSDSPEAAEREIGLFFPCVKH